MNDTVNNLEFSSAAPDKEILPIIQFPDSIKVIAIYNASFGTRELAPALLSAIRSVHPKPWNIIKTDSFECNRDDILYIIICPAGLTMNDVAMPKYYINWQLEFMIGSYNVANYINRMKKAIVNWDYSTYNIKTSKERDNIDSIYVIPGFNETISSQDILNGNYVYTDEGKDIDVLFLGYCEAYPRRKLIHENFKNSGLNINFVSDLDLEGMKGVIRRSKVCINMAAQDTFILATVRLNILLSNQSCIVSETSIDTYADSLYSPHGVQFVPFDEIVETSWNLVQNFELRRNMAIKSYQWYKNERYWTNIVDFNNLLPST